MWSRAAKCDSSLCKDMIRERRGGGWGSVQGGSKSNPTATARCRHTTAQLPRSQCGMIMRATSSGVRVQCLFK